MFRSRGLWGHEGSDGAKTRRSGGQLWQTTLAVMSGDKLCGSSPLRCRRAPYVFSKLTAAELAAADFAARVDHHSDPQSMEDHLFLTQLRPLFGGDLGRFHCV